MGGGRKAKEVHHDSKALASPTTSQSVSERREGSTLAFFFKSALLDAPTVLLA